MAAPGPGARFRRHHGSSGASVADLLDELRRLIHGKRQPVWMRIMQAIEELQRERPGDGEAVH